MNQRTFDAPSPEQKWGALRITGTYLILGGLWILFSDEAAAALTRDPALLKQISLYKGWGYILVTSLLLYSMIRQHSLRLSAGEKDLRASESRFSTIFQASPVGICITRIQDSYIVEANEAFYRLIGYAKAETEGQTTVSLNLWVDLAQREVLIHKLQTEKKLFNEEVLLRQKGGEIREMLLSSEFIVLNQEEFALNMLMDISERKQAEVELQNSRAKLNSIISSAMDAIITIDENQGIVLFNTAAEFMFRIPAAEALGQPLSKFIPERFRPPHEDHVNKFYEYKKNNHTTFHPFKGIYGLRQDGEEFPCEVSMSHVDMADSKLFTAILRDTTERERAEEEIRYQASLLANVSEAIVSTDLEYRIKSWNKAAEVLYGWKAEEAIGKLTNELVSTRFINSNVEEAWQQLLKEGSWQGQLIQQNREGTESHFLSSGSLIYDPTGQPSGIVFVNRDISSTVKHQREVEAIGQVSAALRAAVSRDEMVPIMLDQLSTLFEAKGTAFVTPGRATDQVMVEMAQGVLATVLQEYAPFEESISGQVLTTQTPYLNNEAHTETLLPKAEHLGENHAVSCVPLVAHQQAIGTLWLARKQPLTESDLKILTAVADIAANAIYRAGLFDQTQQQLKRLAILHAMDAAIASSFDLRPTLYILIGQLLNQLEVDAAAVFLYNPHTLNLECTAGNGFRNPAIKRVSLHLGEARTGQTALEHRIIVHDDFQQYLLEHPHPTHRLLQGEEFIKYLGLPLMSKGEIKGVLELFHRQPFPTDESWLDFLETLGRQVAIAIDNIEMLEDIQRSKLELELAYDATIEGWSRVLDLRDKETEGHSQRVTEITLELAYHMGIREDEIIHIRRGALLHDIGKMGVPDAILLKPDKLNEEEWAIMRQHPSLAYKMLTPISYLKPALDIPLYHHEKWDGTGYPHGLKGEQIPLAARIFAVADVWDALTSNRPYRAAWSEEKAYAYIREQAGIHFDPQVVATFLNSR